MTAILRVVAEIVCSRPGMGLGPDELVAEHTSFLLKALETSPGLRRRAAVRLDGTRPSTPTRELAALLLHPDPAVVRAAIAFLTDPSQERAQERASRQIGELKAKLRRTTTRFEYARKDAADASKRLEEMREAKTGLEERIDYLTEQLTYSQHRFADPRAVASALLAILEEPPPVQNGDAADRDPHKPLEPAAPRHNEELLAAVRATGLSADELLRVVRAVVSPPPPSVKVTAELDLRVTPLGGGTEIGGSCVLVEAGGTRILVDAGLRTGEGTPAPTGIEQALDGPLQGVVVTHAHNDHCGYVPALAARRPNLRIFGTRETARIMPLMWCDTAKLMRRRERQAVQWGSSAPALYGTAETDVATRRCEEVPYGVPRQIGRLTIELFPAGHILGAAGVVVRAGDRRVAITGDISGFRQESVGGYDLPESAREPDLLVLETTCCEDNHGSRKAAVDEFLRAVQEVWQGGGRVLVPAFALGRAQEIALLMRRHLPEVPVRVDGLAVELSRVFEDASAHRLKIFDGPVAVADRPAELDTFTNGVIITTSGMLTGGPAVQWATRVLPEAGSALFVSGYQDEESPGAALLRLAEGDREFTLPDHDKEITVSVRARVASMRLSAHADRHALLDIADELAPRSTMLVHGLAHRQRKFAEVLRLRDHRVTDTALWRG